MKLAEIKLKCPRCGKVNSYADWVSDYSPDWTCPECCESVYGHSLALNSQPNNLNTTA